MAIPDGTGSLRSTKGEMKLSDLERRVSNIETLSTRVRPDTRCSCRSTQNSHPVSWLGELDELSAEARLIMEHAKSAGDSRTALAAVRVRCCILELAAKLRGDLDERSPTNILNITLDPETAKRLAETYLARHKSGEVEPE